MAMTGEPYAAGNRRQRSTSQADTAVDDDDRFSQVSTAVSRDSASSNGSGPVGSGIPAIFHGDPGSDPQAESPISAQRGRDHGRRRERPPTSRSDREAARSLFDLLADVSDSDERASIEAAIRSDFPNALSPRRLLGPWLRRQGARLRGRISGRHPPPRTGQQESQTNQGSATPVSGRAPGQSSDPAGMPTGAPGTAGPRTYNPRQNPLVATQLVQSQQDRSERNRPRSPGSDLRR
jgi:hypothetical protein